MSVTSRRTGVLVAVVLLAAALKFVYHEGFADNEPLADAPYGDTLAYFDEVERHWQSNESFALYKPPLFTALLFFTGAHEPDGAAVVRGVHLALGLVTVTLIYLMAKARAGPVAGVLASLTALAYAPLTFQETKLLDTTTGLALGVVACFLNDRCQRREASTRHVFVAGLAFGVAALARPFNLVLAAGYAATMIRTPTRAAVLMLGAGLPILPLTAHNYLATGDFMPVNYSDGYTMLVGNNENARGIFALPSGYPDGILAERIVENEIASSALGRTATPGEQRGYSMDRAWDFLLASPQRTLELVGDKLRFALASVEIGDNYSLAREQRRWQLLTPFALPFGALLALAVFGFLVAPRGELDTIAVPVLTTLAVLLLTYVTSRYRLPMAPFLAIAAGVGLVRAASAPRGRVALAAVAALALGAISFRGELPYTRAEITAADETFSVILDLHAATTLAGSDDIRAARALAEGIAESDDPTLGAALTALIRIESGAVRDDLIGAARDAAPGSEGVKRAIEAASDG